MEKKRWKFLTIINKQKRQNVGSKPSHCYFNNFGFVLYWWYYPHTYKGWVVSHMRYFLYKTVENSRLYTLQFGIECTRGIILQPTFYCTKLIEANKTLYRSCNHKFFNYCQTPDLPNSPVQLLIGKSGRLYIRVL